MSEGAQNNGGEHPAEFTLEQLAELLNLFGEANYQYAQRVDERLDSMDRLHASLAMSVMEIATTLEALSREVMASRTDEEKQAFLERVESLKQDTLSVLRSMTEQSEGPLDNEQEEG